MRARALLLVLAVLAVGALAWLNWAEITRPTTLNLGLRQAQAPLGLVLLTLLGIAAVIFAAGLSTLYTRSLVESRHHAKALNAQRELADKAEASRFTDLRGLLDQHLRESRQRAQITSTETERLLLAHQREARSQLDQLGQVLLARMAELEARLDRHLGPRDVRVVEPAALERQPQGRAVSAP